MKDANLIIEAMNEALLEKRMHQKELYEHLIAKGVMKPNSEKEFKGIYLWALDQGYIDKGKVKNWNKKRGKLPKYFTKEQLVKIFEVIDRPKDAIACFMALMCGMRINEICTLKVDNIDFAHHRILIEDSKNTNRSRDNYGTDRYVDFDPAIDNIIKKWIEIIGGTSKWFIPSDKSPDMHLRKKSMHERFRIYLKEAGLLQIEYTLRYQQRIYGKKREKVANRHKYCFHCFRHTMACIIYNTTNDIYAVNQFLGHKQLDTTTVYAKMTSQNMKKTIATVFKSINTNYYEGNHFSNPAPVQQTQHMQAPVVVSANSAAELLDMQFVNGEVDEESYLRKKKILTGERPKQVIEVGK